MSFKINAFECIGLESVYDYETSVVDVNCKICKSSISFYLPVGISLEKLCNFIESHDCKSEQLTDL